MHRYAAALLLLLSGCAIPARDNPSDPANSPDAELTVTPSDGSPHTTFTFKVAGSGNLTSQLDLAGGGTFSTAMPGGVYTGEIPLAPGVFGSSGVGSFTLTVNARVTSSSGRGLVSTTVHLHNSAPVLNLGPDAITAAWEQPTVRLDPCGEVLGCPSPDPDGPAGLTWAWRQLAGTPVISGAVTTSTLTFAAPLTPQTMVFELTVNDGFASATQPVSVRVGHPAWVASASPPRMFRFFPDSQTVQLASLAPVIAASTTTNGDVWLVTGTYQQSNWEADRISSAGTVLGRWPLGGADIQGGGPILGEGSSGGWVVVGIETTSYTPQLEYLHPITVGTGGTFTTVNLPIQPNRMVADPTVPGGVVVLSGGQGVHVAPDLSVGPVFSFGGTDDCVVALDGSIWGAVQAGASQIQIHHLLPGDVDGEITFNGDLAGLVPGSDGVLVVVSDGLVLDYVQPLVDTTTLLPQLTVPAVNVEVGASIAGNGDGNIFMLGPQEATLRTLTQNTTGFDLTATTTLEQLNIPLLDAQPFPVAVADPFNGGVLVTGGAGTGQALYVRVPASGLPLEQALSILPATFLTETGRGSYWTQTFANGGQLVVRYDASGDVLGQFSIPVTEESNDIFAAGPDSGVFIVTRVNSSGDSLLRQLDRTGTPVGTPADFAAVNLLSLGFDSNFALACIATEDASNNEFLSRLSGGTQSQFASGPQEDTLPGVAATRSGACWGWLPNSTSVFYSDATGSASIPGFPSGVKVITADPYDDSAWLVDGTGEEVFHLAASSGTILGQFALPAVIGESSLGAEYQFSVSPECDPASQAGQLSCRNLWIADGLNPGTIYRLDGTGTRIAQFQLLDGLAGYFDVR